MSWFSTQNLGDGITLITEPPVASEAGGNIYHIPGRDFDLVIDAGLGLAALKVAFPELFHRPGHPVILVLTHSHFDHMGGAAEFTERWMHPAEADIAARPSLENTAASGWLEDRHVKALPDGGSFSAAAYSIGPAPATALLEEGSAINIGDRRFDVLHLPGHSPGSIGLFNSSRGHLFSGDSLFNGTMYDDVYHSDSGAFTESLRRIADLPLRQVFGGHYQPMDPERAMEVVSQNLQRNTNG